MKDSYKQILTINRPALVEEIDSENGLLNQLESKKVLTRRQAVSISRNPDPFRKNELILDALHKRPDDDFDKFCEALKATNQGHVVDAYLLNNATSSASSASSSPSSSPLSAGTVPNEQLMRLGIDIRVKNELDKIAEKMSNLTLRQGGLIVDSAAVPALSQDPVNHENMDTEEQAPVFNSPQLIDSEDIVVRRCDSNFYASAKDNSYPMNRRSRGKCLIINICHTNGQDPREGAEVDERILHKLFTELHYDVHVFKNLTARQIDNEMVRVAEDSSLVSDQSFVLFVMSHGSIRYYDGVFTEVIFGSDGDPIATSQILEPLAKCPALTGKPKIAFFQACRGDNYDQVDCISDKSSEDEDMTRPDACPPGANSLKDFVVGFPTQSGFRSFRNTRNGSWYINAIVRVFMEDACHMDVSAMLRKVNGIVSKWLPKTNDPRMQQKGQIASISDNLTKPYLYLFPGIVEDN